MSKLFVVLPLLLSEIIIFSLSELEIEIFGVKISFTQKTLQIL